MRLLQVKVNVVLFVLLICVVVGQAMGVAPVLRKHFVVENKPSQLQADAKAELKQKTIAKKAMKRRVAQVKAQIADDEEVALTPEGQAAFEESLGEFILLEPPGKTRAKTDSANVQ